jgi:hypothetical protein
MSDETEYQLMLPPSQFVYGNYTTRFFPTTCFGLMGFIYNLLLSPATLPTLASIYTLGVHGM